MRLAILSLSVLLASLGTSIANVALPELATHFTAPFGHVQWVVLAYLLATTTLVVSAGRLGDLTGRRRLFLGGILLFAAASALCAAAPTLGWLIAARAAQGAGAAVMLALSMTFVAEAVPRERLGSAMGWLGTMSAAGTALGPSLGGVLIDAFGWRAIFLVNVPLGVATWLLAMRFVARDGMAPQRERARFDTLGTLLLAVTLACYALAMTIDAVLLVAAAAGIALFVLVEMRAASPLLRLELFRDRVLSAGFAINALVTTIVMATLVVGPFYLSRALGLDAGGVGLILSIGPLVAALSGAPAGMMVDRLGSRRMSIAALVAMAGGTGALSLLPARLGVPGYVIPLAAVTAGYALFQAANNTAVMKDVRQDQRGVVSGMLNLSRNIGLITGASVMGAVFAIASGSADVSTASPDAVAAGMHATFGVAVALVATALAIALRARNVAVVR